STGASSTPSLSVISFSCVTFCHVPPSAHAAGAFHVPIHVNGCRGPDAPTDLPRPLAAAARHTKGAGTPSSPTSPSELTALRCAYRRARASLGGATPPALRGRGEPPPTGVLCGLLFASVPAGAMDRPPAGGPAAIAGGGVKRPIAIAW